MDRCKPVITGISAICSLGHQLEVIIEKLLRKETNFSKIPFKSDIFQNRRVAFVQNFNIKDFVKDRKTLRFMSRETQLSVCALLLCLVDSAIDVDKTYNENDISLFAGTGSSGINLNDIEKLLNSSSDEKTGLFSSEKFGRDALYKLNPLTSFKILPNMPPAVAAIYAKIKGNNLIFNPWEGNSLLAFYEALHEVLSGRSKIIFCGGSDCKTHANAFITFTEYGLFKESDVVLSEGSAFLAVENYESAVKRNAKLYCTIRNITRSSYAWPPAIDKTSSENRYLDIVQNALTGSDLETKDIDLVVSSNDFSYKSDEAENDMIGSQFGHCAVISPKKIIGNTFAAAGIINLAIAAYILKHDILANEKKINRVLVTSFGPGSEKFCMILEKA